MENIIGLLPMNNKSACTAERSKLSSFKMPLMLHDNSSNKQPLDTVMQEKHHKIETRNNHVWCNKIFTFKVMVPTNPAFTVTGSRRELSASALSFKSFRTTSPLQTEMKAGSQNHK